MTKAQISEFCETRLKDFGLLVVGVYQVTWVGDDGVSRMTRGGGFEDCIERAIKRNRLIVRLLGK